MATARKNSAKVVVGIKSHSGWAALVVVAISKNGLEVIDRRRIELVDSENISWAKQPYHAAEGLPAKEANTLVERAIKSARQVALREIKNVIKRLKADGHDIACFALLTPSPMPEWTTGQILAVHFRMHKAEGVLFPDVLARAISKSGLPLVSVPEKELATCSAKTSLISKMAKEVPAVGKKIGPPWSADQKNATLAAVVAFGEIVS
jgi:hypothetical protein